MNTDSINAKAVKVRFRGAVDSDDIFDFQVFLSPGDVWTANVSAAGGVTKLTTSDTSCTVPAGVGTTITDFVTTRVATDDPIATAEGYVEIFNMADIPPFLGQFSAANAWSRPASAAAGGIANPLFKAVKHVAGAAGAPWTPPCTATILENIEGGWDADANGVIDIPSTYSAVAGAANSATAYAANTTDNLGGAAALSLGSTSATTGLWVANALAGAAPVAAPKGLFIEDANGQQAPYLAAPTGTLFGNWMLVNTTDAGAYGGVMTTLSAAQPTRIVYSSQLEEAVDAQNLATDFPNIAATADAVLLQQFVKTAKYDFPDVSTPYELGDNLASVRAAAISSAMLVTKVQNEFFSDTSVNAATDFVLSQPTRRYHVAGRVGKKGAYDSKTAADAWAQLTTGVTNAYTPTLPYARVTTVDNKNGHRACGKTGSSSMFDREEYLKVGGSKPVVSPSTVVNAPDVYLCNEAGVVSINNPTVAAGKFTGSVLSQYTGMGVNGISGPFLGASNLGSADPYLKNAGWIDWSLTTGTATTGNTLGLPLVGQLFMKVGVGGSGYGVNMPHRFTKGAVALPVPTIYLGGAAGAPLFDKDNASTVVPTSTAAVAGVFYTGVAADGQATTPQP
ncbi:MAG: hypothetical protein IPL70_03165 [Uliginosibacterium sp.]|nr:hypothetical protein [Uliginosibacterium sp.]